MRTRHHTLQCGLRRLALAGAALLLLTSCGDSDRNISARYEQMAREITIEPLSPDGLPDGARNGYGGHAEYQWSIQVTIEQGRMVNIDVLEVGQEEYRTSIQPYIESVLEAQSPVVDHPEGDLMVKGFLKAVEYALRPGGK